MKQITLMSANKTRISNIRQENDKYIAGRIYKYQTSLGENSVGTKHYYSTKHAALLNELAWIRG